MAVFKVEICDGSVLMYGAASPYLSPPTGMMDYFQYEVKK
jgi:hypothetical protein